ncbi:hypothetical protein ONZ51_g12325 [Trametes cubensis]|uniref:F-box domain-containing protein n=1 Tax=Trametes cubensis TaxID=1111947 RepID=A0AAD7TGD4_9APHY|nr:hypothetical protein ONZ51_g12325 [Trametes cubensis]
MTALSLPIEVIEHALGFLDGDFETLAACSLVCRGLLFSCRALVWRHVTLNAPAYKLKEKLDKLTEILTVVPDIGYHVRSLTVLCGQRARMSVEGAIHLCKLFPALRSLTLYSVDSADLPTLFALIHSVPTLEVLHLFDIGDNFVRASTLYPLPPLPPLPYITETSGTSSERGAPSQSNLHVLSVVGRRRLRGPSFQEIAPFVRNAGRESSSLRSLDLRTPVDNELKDEPRVPSFASQLTHFGILVSDMYENGGTDPLGREHMAKIFSDLPLCTSLRSLCFQYDVSAAFFFREYSHHVNRTPPAPSRPWIYPFFLEKLYNLLSAPGGPPFPDLERLTLVFLNPLDWLSNCKAEFDKLAQACLSIREDENAQGKRRYPRFARLEIQVMIADMCFVLGKHARVSDAHTHFLETREKTMSLFEGFTKAGVQVEILWVDRMYEVERS